MGNQNGNGNFDQRRQHQQGQPHVPDHSAQHQPIFPTNSPATGQISMQGHTQQILAQNPQYYHPSGSFNRPLSNSMFNTGIQLQNSSVFPTIQDGSNLFRPPAMLRKRNSDEMSEQNIPKFQRTETQRFGNFNPQLNYVDQFAEAGNFNPQANHLDQFAEAGIFNPQVQPNYVDQFAGAGIFNPQVQQNYVNQFAEAGNLNTQANYQNQIPQPQCGCNCAAELRLLMSRIETFKEKNDAMWRLVKSNKGMEAGALNRPTQSRWRDEEVEALIKLRIEMEPRFKGEVQKGGKRLIWDDVSCEMVKQGYDRDGDMCRLEWNYIRAKEPSKLYWCNRIEQFKKFCSSDAGTEVDDDQSFAESESVLLLDTEEDNGERT